MADQSQAMDDPVNLRQQAEQLWRERKGETPPPVEDADVLRLISELEVHQIELEMQQEELIQARGELEQALAQYMDLYDFAPMGYFTLGRGGDIQRLNLAGSAMLGLERGGLIARRFGLFVADSSHLTFAVFLERVFGSLQKESCEIELVPQGRASIWVHVEGGPERGRRDLVRLAVADISERKRAGDLLRQRLAELQTLHTVSATLRDAQSRDQALPILLDQALIAIGSTAGTILLYDSAQDELSVAVSRGWFDQLYLVPVKPGQGMAGRVFVSGLTHVSVEYRDDPMTRPDNRHRIPAGWGGICAVIPAGEMKIGLLFVALPHPQAILPEHISLIESLAHMAGTSLHRMSLHDETTALLRLTRVQARRTQQIIDTSPEGIVVLDPAGRLIQINPVALSLFPDSAKPVAGQIPPPLGDHSLVDFMQTAAPNQPWQELIWGEPPRTVEVAAQILGSPDQPEGWLLLLREVTEERQRQRYQQAQDHLAIVGQMAAGIAHDFNNILAAIILYATLLQNSHALSAKEQGYLAGIQTQSQYAASLVRQILDFGRRSILEKKALDLVSLVQESIRLMGRTLPENVRLRVAHDHQEYVVFGDPTRLQQMLINLAINARDAMPDGGAVTFALHALNLPSGAQAPLPDMKPGDWVQLDVTDTGSGIDAKHLPHLFQPFFTTKAPDKGTGLGLAQVYGIIKQHNGVIGVESHMGRGTTFSIYLPLHQTALVQVEALPLAVESECGSGHTILITEDSDALRMAVSDTLELFGHQVLMAADGYEALRILGEQAGAVSLLISDLVMPQMGGMELARLATTHYPGVKVLIMTGHPLDMSQTALTQAGIHGWIEKPFSIDLLNDQICRILDRDGGSGG